jgi:hypothetical protein
VNATPFRSTKAAERLTLGHYWLYIYHYWLYIYHYWLYIYHYWLYIYHYWLYIYHYWLYIYNVFSIRLSCAHRVSPDAAISVGNS